jgi:predicted nucleic acid-binding protein
MLSRSRKLNRDHFAFMRALRAWFNAVLEAFEGLVLPLTRKAAMRCAPIRVTNPKDYRDSILAATALVHGFTIVMRNVRDYERTGAKLLNPW